MPPAVLAVPSPVLAMRPGVPAFLALPDESDSEPYYPYLASQLDEALSANPMIVRIQH
jgi:hypothetical protein